MVNTRAERRPDQRFAPDLQPVRFDGTEPIRKEKLTIAPPGISGRALWIIFGEVVAGNPNGFPGLAVAPEFIGQSVGVVFDVVEHVDSAATAILDQAQPRLFRRGEDLQT